ncbi:MAG: PIN domain-containing protein [bacterium]
MYALDLQSPHNDRCYELVESLRHGADPWYVTWGIVYEFMRVTTHLNILNKPMSSSNAWHYITDLLASPGMHVLAETPRHIEVAREVFSIVPEARGSLVFDARTAILMREHGITRIITRDTDFFRFPFIEVIDPLQSPPTRVSEGRGKYAGRRRRAPAGVA